MACSCGSSCRNCRQSGGPVVGPSHANGGVPFRNKATGENYELEGGEFVMRKDAVDKYGVQAMEKINNMSADPAKVRKLQYGGTVGGGRNNPITEAGLMARPGQYIFRDSGRPYEGPYHRHQNGELMIGAGKVGVNHEIKPNEVIVRKLENGGRTNMARNRRRFQQGGHTHTLPKTEAQHAHHLKSGAQGHRHLTDSGNQGPAGYTGTPVGHAGSGTPGVSYGMTNMGSEYNWNVGEGEHRHGAVTPIPRGGRRQPIINGNGNQILSHTGVGVDSGTCTMHAEGDPMFPGQSWGLENNCNEGYGPRLFGGCAGWDFECNCMCVPLNQQNQQIRSSGPNGRNNNVMMNQRRNTMSRRPVYQNGGPVRGNTTRGRRKGGLQAKIDSGQHGLELGGKK